MKTVIGTNKTLYLYSELEQHYLNKNTTEIENNSLNVLFPINLSFVLIIFLIHIIKIINIDLLI
jgi:hypothetical protein